MNEQPILALTQGDPAGVGPEILLRLLISNPADRRFRPLLIAERAALESVPGFDEVRESLEYFDSEPTGRDLAALGGAVGVLDPVGLRRRVEPGASGAADAHGAVAALDAGVAAVAGGLADALVTAPISKASIARHHLPGFTGHTDYLAQSSGLERYGRDYLMAFLAPDLQVALLSTHLPLSEALARVRPAFLEEALERLHDSAGGRIAVAGVDPHAGEGGLLGLDDGRYVTPAVAAARARGIDAHGPESADSLFVRARKGEFDWVLALYHDQGLIAVKTAAFGLATNWTLGLPYLRTSVDHGTAFAIAGKGVADAGPLGAVVETTLKLLAGELPRRS